MDDPVTRMPPPPRTSPLESAESADREARGGADVEPTPNRLPVYHGPFTTPTKAIQDKEGIEAWKTSQTYATIMNFILRLNESVKTKPNTTQALVSPAVEATCRALEEVESWVKEIPPIEQPMRFGNKAFRIWQKRLQEESPRLVKSILPEDKLEAVPELVPYFTDSFGNATRIDYGTGHENNFCAWMACLDRIGVFEEADYTALVLQVFAAYIRVMRLLQLTYVLEPAGSHGVWGLDDFHFLPFLWGAAQLIDHPRIKPKSIHRDMVLEGFSKDYIYLDSIAFIKKIKKGPFGEVAPLLNDISGVPNWGKVNSGLIKMYHVEVMQKYPVIQHFLFGNILPPP